GRPRARCRRGTADRETRDSGARERAGVGEGGMTVTRGRPPRGLTSIDLLEGPSEGKKRLRTILERLGGQTSVEDACAVLGISRAFYYVLEAKVLNSAL